MSATVNAYREFTAEQRKKLAEEGKALSDGSYPIETVDDVKNAIQAVGRAKDPEAARAHIKKRAADLGAEDLIPDDWAAAATTFRSDFSAAELALGEWFVARRKKKAKAECADCDDDGVIAIETDDYAASGQQFRAPDYIGMTDEPGENWVEQEGGLPPYIKRIANHLIGKGMTEGHAIASAVNTVKRWARGGRVSEHGGGNRGAAHVKPDTIAKAIVALAEWLAKIAAAHAHAAEVMSFAAATTEDVKKAEEDVPPVDVNDTRSALDEGFKFLTEWVGDEANADDPVMGMVKEALDKVGGILDDLDGKKGGKGKAMAASTATFASAAEDAAPDETAPAAAENADPAAAAPEAVDGDDPGEDVPLETAKADSDALAASADSIVAELTAEYNAAQAALTSPE